MSAICVVHVLYDDGYTEDFRVPWAPRWTPTAAYQHRLDRLRAAHRNITSHDDEALTITVRDWPDTTQTIRFVADDAEQDALPGVAS